MPIIISLGTNLGEKKQNLKNAEKELQAFLSLEFKSRIYQSKAVDYLDQPLFFNQVFQFKTPELQPHLLLNKLKNLEIELGRKKSIEKGPRLIDIDIIFFDQLLFQNENLTIPHPAAIYRSFIMEPLAELPFVKELSKTFYIPTNFSNSCQALVD
jgi:2-amino-4-hydroxy-6-hydroxymethyldihydropteridine diphosphokinase